MIPDLSFKPLALSLMLALATGGCHSAPAPEPTEQTEAAVQPTEQPQVTPEQMKIAAQQYVELQRMTALDDRCSWLDPAARAALDSTLGERAAWLGWQGGDMAQVQADAQKAVTADATACSDKEIRHTVELATWQMRVTWALRAHALLPGADRPTWFVDLSTVEQQRPALEEAVATLLSRYEAAIQAAQSATRDEAEMMLAARCEATGAGCPANGDDHFAAYAQAWLTHAEGYADRLKAVEDKVGTMPGDAEAPAD